MYLLRHICIIYSLDERTESVITSMSAYSSGERHFFSLFHPFAFLLCTFFILKFNAAERVSTKILFEKPKGAFWAIEFRPVALLCVKQKKQRVLNGRVRIVDVYKCWMQEMAWENHFYYAALRGFVSTTINNNDINCFL